MLAQRRAFKHPYNIVLYILFIGLRNAALEDNVNIFGSKYKLTLLVLQDCNDLKMFTEYGNKYAIIKSLSQSYKRN